MTEPGIGRVLVASLHQAIGEVLPDRLEYYENWLDSSGMRHGTIGQAALNAVLSFLRLEGDAYDRIVELAGRYAAEWTMDAQARGRRALVAAAPRPIRVRSALKTARRIIQGSHPGTRAVVHISDGAGTLDVSGSLFCNVRQSSTHPLCGFYASLVSRLLQLHATASHARIGKCVAVGDDGCQVRFEADQAADADGETKSNPAA
jgi:hypothetical protein